MHATKEKGGERTFARSAAEAKESAYAPRPPQAMGNRALRGLLSGNGHAVPPVQQSVVQRLAVPTGFGTFNSKLQDVNAAKGKGVDNMYGKKTAKNHEVAAPQHAANESASSQILSKAHSIPAQLAVGNRALGQLLQQKIRVRQVRPAKMDVGSRLPGTALPDRLKGSLESLSGMDLSSVRVHRNSDKPAELNALAYTQGRDIHLAPGQDEHLPHEAWHAVQQMQGRVNPTMQTRGVSLNDDAHLEREADHMGSKAATGGSSAAAGPSRSNHSAASPGVAQRKIKIAGLTEKKRKNFVAKINEGSALQYELTASGHLEQVDKKKSAKDEYSTQITKAIGEAQEVVINLVSKDDVRFIDSFAGGQVDYDDLKDMASNLFRLNFLHIIVERFSVADYEKNKAAAVFKGPHDKAVEAEERLMKSFFPKKTIKYKGADFNAASKKVDKAGNGSIDYEFDYTDVKQVYKQPIVGGVTKENIISSKIIIVK